MSRSYKNYPSAKCEHSCKFGKRKANKRFRSTTFDDVSNGGYYKKVFESWDICDYKFVGFSKEDFQQFKKLRRK